MIETVLDRSNLNRVGNARTSPVSINWKQGVGGLWLKNKVLITPRFEVKFTVDINNKGCWDIWSWAMDGFTVILSKFYTNYLSGDGRYLGYKNLYEAFVTEIDMFWDVLLKDKGWNYASFHRCYKSRCNGKENKTQQMPLGFVSLALNFFRNTTSARDMLSLFSSSLRMKQHSFT
ncbi:MAG: hypothetical protein GY861_28010 [bacterium]|nr:hypothetical protein [bacterium]